MDLAQISFFFILLETGSQYVALDNMNSHIDQVAPKLTEMPLPVPPEH